MLLTSLQHITRVRLSRVSSCDVSIGLTDRRVPLVELVFGAHTANRFRILLGVGGAVVLARALEKAAAAIDALIASGATPPPPRDVEVGRDGSAGAPGSTEPPESSFVVANGGQR
jgi:hypothetical protein